MVPELVKVININCIICGAYRWKPGVKAKGPAKTTNASLKRSNGAGDKNTLATLLLKFPCFGWGAVM